VAEKADVTGLLIEMAGGDPGAADRLIPLIYDDLHRVAEERMRAEHATHTLQATALVHEAYLRLVDQTRCRWSSRAQFLAVASEVMRRILVDHARARGRLKRGGEWERVSMEQVLDLATEEGASRLLALDLALRRLETHAPEKARLVTLRFFGGLNQDECAQVLGISIRTAARHWAYAQAWLFRELRAKEAAF
jgi:RNA polymerase sigma-70 factor, ECF subfamily